MNLASGTLFLAGLATFASPCVLPMIPIYLTVLMGGSTDAAGPSRGARLRLLLNGFMFVLGFTIVFVAMGLAATAVGRFFMQHRLLFQQLGGLLVFAFGLKFLGWLHIDALEREKRFHLSAGRRIGPLGALAMGLTFAFGWTPCIGPVLGAVLTFTAVSTTAVGEGALNLLLYAAGIGLPLLALALLAQQGARLLDRVKRFIPRIERATGVVLVAMAVLMVTDSTAILMFGVGEESSAGLSRDLVAQATVAEGAAGIAHAGERVGAAACEAGSPTCALPGDGRDSAGPEPAFLPIGDGPLVAFFHRPDCPACLRMAPIIAAMTETCAGKGLHVEKVDVSSRPQRALAAEMAVRGTPTLLFLDHEGTEVARLVGASGLDAVSQAVAILMGEACADFSTL